MENRLTRSECDRAKQTIVIHVCLLIRVHIRCVLNPVRAQALTAAAESMSQSLSHRAALLMVYDPLTGCLESTKYSLCNQPNKFQVKCYLPQKAISSQRKTGYSYIKLHYIIVFILSRKFYSTWKSIPYRLLEQFIDYFMCLK